MNKEQLIEEYAQKKREMDNIISESEKMHQKIIANGKSLGLDFSASTKAKFNLYPQTIKYLERIDAVAYINYDVKRDEYDKLYDTLRNHLNWFNTAPNDSIYITDNTSHFTR